MKNIHNILFVLLLPLTLCLNGCGSIGNDNVGKISCLRAHSRNALTGLDMAVGVDSYLVSHAIKDQYGKDPEHVFNIILEQVNLSKQRNDLSALIEICMYRARRTTGKEQAKWLWRTCFYSYRYFYDRGIQQPLDYNPTRGSVIGQYYNYATGELFNRVRKEVLAGKQSAVIKAEDIQYTCRFETEHLGFAPELFSSLDECLKYMPYGLISYSIRDAMGAAYIGTLGNIKRNELLENPYFAENSTAPLTVFARFDVNNINSLTFEIYNTMMTEETKVNNQRVMLTFDFSTPLAKMMEEPPRLGSLYLLFHPDSIAGNRGVYMMEPYDPQKIPVVFVHGLMSNPRTWTQTINVLLNDPRIRKKYQFWLFGYATGNQIIYSASLLRSCLKETRALFDPGSNNPNFNRMVLVGHSMGGILSKTMVQNTGTILQDGVLNEPVDQLKITPEQKVFLLEMLCYKRLPFVNRVIFVATPHRGSEMAVWSVSRWVSSMIELPETFDYQVRNISKKLLVKAKLRQDDNPDYIATGIDNLSPDDVFLQMLDKIKIDPAVKYHSIIGNEKADGVVGGTDGIVAYDSSHLDGAASEHIVKAGHSVQDTPKGIQAIRQLLLWHLKETAPAPATK